MTDSELQQLIDRAMSAHHEKRFDDEIPLWEQICKELPDRMDFLHNVALAKMHAGYLEEALELFEDLVVRAPNLSRVQNNRAVLMLRLGADLQHLLPAFLAAVYFSEGPEDFIRHILNVCQASAFGPDHGGPELLDAIREPVLELVRERFTKEHVDGNLALFQNIFSAYRHFAHYRVALGCKDWKGAESALTAAQDTFRSIGLDNFSRGSEAFRERLIVCRDTFGFLEDVGTDQSLTPTGALDRITTLLSRAAALRNEDEASIQNRFLDLLGFFLSLFLRQLAFLSGTIDDYEPPTEEIRIMMWLSGSSFRSIGDDLLTVINFSDRRCLELTHRLDRIASPAVARQARQDEWVRIALCVHGRVFDFRGVDVALAHSVLGWRDNALERIRSELAAFRDFVERQAYADIIVDGTPRENIARALIQARLTARSYREVPVRGGRSDVLAFVGNQKRILVEAKIWRGAEYHEQGLRELAEYVAGENDDGGLLGAFYLVFDPTESAKAIAHEGSPVLTRKIGETSVDVLLIRLRPPTPSKTSMGGSHTGGRVA